MSKRSRFRDELMRYQVSWSERIASKDSDFKDYAGASPEDGLKLAKIDFALFLIPKNNPLHSMLKLARTYLIQRKKAFFCTVKMGEVSMLGAIKGRKPFDIKAKLRRFSEP